MEDQARLFQGTFFVSVAISLVLFVALVWAYVRIIQKAGYSGWNVLWVLVPIVNIIMIFYFAFAEWPITARVRDLERRVFGDAPEPTLGRPS